MNIKDINAYRNRIQDVINVNKKMYKYSNMTTDILKKMEARNKYIARHIIYPYLYKKISRVSISSINNSNVVEFRIFSEDRRINDIIIKGKDIMTIRLVNNHIRIYIFDKYDRVIRRRKYHINQFLETMLDGSTFIEKVVYQFYNENIEPKKEPMNIYVNKKENE